MLRKAPKQARAEEMVACILAGATRVLRSTRLADATTNRIAEVAGVSVGSRSSISAMTAVTCAVAIEVPVDIW